MPGWPRTSLRSPIGATHSPLLRKLFERVAGISAQRALPAWRRDVFNSDVEATGPTDGREVVLFADTFNRAYERENLDAALRVLVAGGYRVHLPRPADNGRPLCCGRTFLSAGLVDNARTELDRLVTTYAPFALRGVPIVGLEPSCLLTLRDELLSLRSDDTAKSVSGHALLFEEFLVREAEAGRLQLPLGSVAGRALVHGHCHQNRLARSSRSSRCCALFPILKSKPSSPVVAAWPVRSVTAPTPTRPRSPWPNSRCCRRSGAQIPGP